MTIEQWTGLKTGDKIKHINGDVERIYVSSLDGIQYIEGKNNLFPLAEFNNDDWELEEIEI